MTKQNQLDRLKAEIIVSQQGTDLAVQATQLVMGSGSPDAEMILIGEAPGKKEDETGVPFVGAAGRFLDQMLEAAKLARSDIYITNIVKYRPPKNRDPTTAEKASFLPYLLRELEIIDPKIVITLGRHSMEYFLPNVKIGEVHGQLQQVIINGRKITVAPLYHPAAALYNGSLRQTLIDDFCRIVSAIKRDAY